MTIVDFILEILRQVPLWAATGVGGFSFGMWLGYKIGVFKSWVSERALSKALKVKVPKMLEDAEE